MTAEERIKAAINLEMPDRTPVVPLFNVVCASQLMGMTLGECCLDQNKARQATIDAFDALGGFDGLVAPGFSNLFAPRLSSILAMPLFKVPGRDLPENAVPQYDEREILTADDYDEIANLGWRGFTEEYYHRFMNRSPEAILAWGERQTGRTLKDIEIWRRKGVPCLAAANMFTPLMTISIFRTITQFTLDLHRRPDKVAAAFDATVDDFIEDTIEAAKIAGLPAILLPLERGGGFIYPLRIFERFEFPYMKKMVEAFTAAGFIVVLHFDQDWTLNLPYLKELPRAKCICELDGTTDIFKAKEVLRDHMCIMGDVPSWLQSMGTPQEMEAYCKELIDVIGDGGGFILSSACQVAIDAKFENLKAMMDTAKNYLPAHNSD